MMPSKILNFSTLKKGKNILIVIVLDGRIVKKNISQTIKKNYLLKFIQFFQFCTRSQNILGLTIRINSSEIPNKKN